MNFEFFVGERGKFKGVERWLGDIRVELLNPPSLSPSEDATGDYRLQPLDLRAQWWLEDGKVVSSGLCELSVDGNWAPVDAFASTSNRLRDVREKVSLVDRVNVEGRPAYDGAICDRLGSMVTVAHSDWHGKLRVVGITMGWRPIDMHFDPRGLREHVLLLEDVNASAEHRRYQWFEEKALDYEDRRRLLESEPLNSFQWNKTIIRATEFAEIVRGCNPSKRGWVRKVAKLLAQRHGCDCSSEHRLKQEYLSRLTPEQRNKVYGWRDEFTFTHAVTGHEIVMRPSDIMAVYEEKKREHPDLPLKAKRGRSILKLVGRALKEKGLNRTAICKRIKRLEAKLAKSADSGSSPIRGIDWTVVRAHERQDRSPEFDDGLVEAAQKKRKHYESLHVEASRELARKFAKSDVGQERLRELLAGAERLREMEDEVGRREMEDEVGRQWFEENEWKLQVEIAEGVQKLCKRRKWGDGTTIDQTLNQYARNKAERIIDLLKRWERRTEEINAVDFAISSLRFAAEKPSWYEDALGNGNRFREKWPRTVKQLVAAYRDARRLSST